MTRRSTHLTWILILAISATVFFCHVLAVAQSDEGDHSMDNVLKKYESSMTQPLNTERISPDKSTWGNENTSAKYLENSAQGEDESVSPHERTEDRAVDEKHSPIMLDALELVDMEIKDVLKLISRKSGLNIVANGNVAGRVTIFMQNVEVRDALRIILDSNDLAFEEEKGMLRVMTAQDYERIYGRKFGQKTETSVVRLKGLNAIDAVNLLNQMKTVIGRVVADEQSNTVMIEDTPEKVKELDRKSTRLNSSH